MKFVDSYVAEVGRHLPEKSRADIEKEIHSMIEDSLEDESRAKGLPVDEDMEVEVLKRLGPPEKMATSYLPARYLIGPDLFPHFLTTLRIVIAVLTVVAAIGFGVSLARSQPTLPEAIAQGISSLLNGLIYAVGIVVVIFAIIQLSTPGLKLNSAEWDPRKLKAVPDTEKISLPEQIIEIFLSVLAITVFNLYPDWIGISSLVNGQWVHVPVLTDAFLRLVPWFSLLWALDIGHNVWLASKGRWEPALRWAQIALNLGGIALLGFLLFGPAFISINSADAARLGWSLDAGQIEMVTSSIYLAVRIAMGVTVAITALNTLKLLYNLTLRGRIPVLDARA